MSRPIIEITPSPEQYRQLCRDLEALRYAGAATNTGAILDAVHQCAQNVAEGYDDQATKMAGRRVNGPGPEPWR